MKFPFRSSFLSPFLIASFVIVSPEPTKAQTPAIDQQNITVVQQLFEYPIAPEELSSLQDKSDWIMENFWNNMDLKSLKPVDQSALNHAFQVYCVPMQWASKEAVLQGNKNLLKKIEKNPTLLLQFTKAAEENLFGPRSSMWIDEVYVLYPEAVCKSKKIDKIRKIRYQDQLNRLTRSAVGNNAPVFDYETRDGNTLQYFPMATFTIIEFGDPECDDCRLGRLAMESNIPFSRLVEKGLVNVMFIIPSPDDDWKEKVVNFPSNWIIGASDNADDSYDLRQTPAIFVVDGKGKIKAKNISVRDAMDMALTEFSDK